jgi:cytochrome P450
MYDTSPRGSAAGRSHPRPARSVPVSPRAYPLVGHLPLLRDVLTAAAQLRSLGDVVKLRLPPHDVFVLHHPRDIEQWLVHEHAAFRKDWSTKALDQVLGQGPLISEGQPWRRGRRLAQGELSARRVEALVPRMQACIDGLLAHLLDAASRAEAPRVPARSPSAPPSPPSPPPSELARPPSMSPAAQSEAPAPEDDANRPTTLYREADPVAPPTELSTAAPSPAPDPESLQGRPDAGVPAGETTAAPANVAAPAVAEPASVSASDSQPEPEAEAATAREPAADSDAAPQAPPASKPAAAQAAVPSTRAPEPRREVDPAAPTETATAAGSTPLPEPVPASSAAPVPEPVPASVAASAPEPASSAEPSRNATPPEPSRADDLASAVRAKVGAAADSGASEDAQELSTPGGAPWDLLELMVRLSLDIAVSTLLGPDADRVAPALQPLLEEFLRQQLGSAPGLKLPDWLPTRGNRRARANHARIGQLVAEAVGQRRAAGEAVALQPDLLGRLLRAHDDAGALLTDAQVTEEALAHLLLGHEPTALLLTFAITLIAQHPDVERRVLAELDQHASYPGESPLAAVERLPYLDAVLRETLRLYPSAYAVAREAVADAKIGECTIPRGAQVWAFQWSVQRDPRFFHMPERFRPERWVHGETRDLPRFAYFPLTGGLRASPGAHYVMAQVKLALARLLPRLSFRLVVPGVPAVVAGSSLRPKEGVPVYVALR